MRIFPDARLVMALRTLVVSASVCHPDVGRARGRLGGQGLGDPPGQRSTRALAVGGANAELGPGRPRNPAAVSSWGSPGLHLQYDPEFRQVSVTGDGDRTMTARFPILSGATRLGA